MKREVRSRPGGIIDVDDLDFAAFANFSKFASLGPAELFFNKSYIEALKARQTLEAQKQFQVQQLIDQENLAKAHHEVLRHVIAQSSFVIASDLIKKDPEEPKVESNPEAWPISWLEGNKP